MVVLMKLRSETLANGNYCLKSDMESLTFRQSIYSLHLSIRGTIYSYENELIGPRLESLFLIILQLALP